MERRWIITVVMLLVAVAGCSSEQGTDPTASAPSPAASAVPPTYADPAAQVANAFLEAVVKGETSRANSLLTPLAVERITAALKRKG